MMSSNVMGPNGSRPVLAVSREGTGGRGFRRCTHGRRSASTGLIAPLACGRKRVACRTTGSVSAGTRMEWSTV